MEKQIIKKETEQKIQIVAVEKLRYEKPLINEISVLDTNSDPGGGDDGDGIGLS